MVVLSKLSIHVTDALAEWGTTPYQAFLAISLVYGLLKLYECFFAKEDIPIMGAKGPFSQTRTRIISNFTCTRLLIKGFKQFGHLGKPFKLRTPGRDMVILTSPSDIDQLKTVDGSILSFEDAILDLSVHYTVGKAVLKNPYHIPVISKSFTQHLSAMLPDITSELAGSFEENTNIGKEWTTINTHDVMSNIISRTTNLVLVGAPLCRDKTYLDVLTAFSTKALVGGMVVDMFPDILKSIVAKIIINRESALATVTECVKPMLQERIRKLEELGDKWTNRPRDAAQWIVESAPDKSDFEDMTARIILLNFAAIHTSTLSIIQILYDLSMNPEYVEPVRQEVESVLQECGGWTVSGMNKMKKLDSIIRETLRMNSVLTVTSVRRSRVPFTFSSGTHIEKGTTVGAPANPVHTSSDYYEDPLKYDGFRHARLREKEENEHKHQATSATKDYLVFGLGKHACPGRFFVVNELKILTAYLICNYEFKLPTNKRPENVFFSFSCAPDTKVKMLFREYPERSKSYWRNIKLES